MRLFREHGVAAHVRARRSPAAAGVSERTLWRLFRTKEACVEPLLSDALDGVPVGPADLAGRLWTWPSTCAPPTTSASGPARADIDAVLAVVRMSPRRAGRCARCGWCCRSAPSRPSPTSSAPRMGLPPDAPEVRVRAAAVNAALRVATDDAAADGGTRPAEHHRERLAAALRDVTRLPGPA